jgi:Baseplate J-like protein
MPSPDFSQYIDLTSDDRTAEDLYDDAVEYARIAMPEFTPRVGTIEDSILQACALLASANIATLNRIPNGLMEGILGLMGFSRYESTFATVEVVFVVANVGDSVPIDFFVTYEAEIGDSIVQYPFRTTSTATSVGDNEITMTLTCDIAGVIPSIQTGSELTIIQPNASVLSCSTSSAVTQGSEPETDEEYFARATTYLASLSTSLVTAAQIEQFVVSTFADAHRCRVYDLKYFPRVLGTIIPDVPSSTAVATTSASFVTNSTFTDYTRVINRTASSGGQASVLSGLYDTQTVSGQPTKIQFEFEGDGLVTPLDAEFIDMYKLRNDYTGTQSGTFAIFVCDENGLPLSTETKQNIYDAVAARVVAGLYFVVLDALICDMSFNIDISVDPEYSATSIVASVADEIESYISPGNWPEWETIVRVFDIVVRANAIPGVAYVNSVTASITPYNGVTQAAPGNDNAIIEINPGGGVTALEMVYLGSLPRSTVTVSVS